MPFKDFGLDAGLVQATRKLGFTEPTPVQAGAIPPALTGKDVLATAQTGTGKTAAFLLPTLHHLLSQPRGSVRAVVLSPTRELATQIESSCRNFIAHLPLKCALVVGGQPMFPQERAIVSAPDIVIATPGRLLDHFNRAAPLFAKVTMFVLDEADSMLDMGFLPDVKRIVAKLPGRKQTLLFSATMPPVIANLARELLKNPATVQIGRRSTTAVGITQAAYPVPTHLKTALLRHMLRNIDMPSVLVFTRTKHGAKKLAQVISADGFSVAELHSNRTPAQRTKAMEGFRRGACQVMVATNIAARGLDVAHVTHVISTDVPDVPEEYVHRIGRTGRAGQTGDAFVFVAPEEESSLIRIERQVGQRVPRVTLPDFDYTQANAAGANAKLTKPASEADKRRAARQAAPKSNGPRPHSAPQSGGPRSNTAPPHGRTRSPKPSSSHSGPQAGGGHGPKSQREPFPQSPFEKQGFKRKKRRDEPRR
ncbi:MAG: DEAD/DEAH box helicase [Gemmataceae bacterium]